MFTEEKVTTNVEDKDIQLMNLEEFFEWYPDGHGRFELHN